MNIEHTVNLQDVPLNKLSIDVNKKNNHRVITLTARHPNPATFLADLIVTNEQYQAIVTVLNQHKDG